MRPRSDAKLDQVVMRMGLGVGWIGIQAAVPLAELTEIVMGLAYLPRAGCNRDAQIED
jgi:hypothetical protein